MITLARTGKIDQLRTRLDQLTIPSIGLQAAKSSGLLHLGIQQIDDCLNGGLAINALHEIRCELARDAGSALGFTLGLLSILSQHKTGRILLVTDPAIAAENGRIFPQGLACFGIDPEHLIIAQPFDMKTAMWAADEAAKCHELMACVFHIRGNPAGFDLTATRRLMLRAQASGVFTCLLRQSGQAEISAAASRWCIAGAPSLPSPEFERSIGNACFHLCLERNRSGPSGQWTATWNHLTKSFGNVSSTSTKSSVTIPPAFTHRPHRPAEMGKVVAFTRPA